MATRLAILVEVVPATNTLPRRWKASIEPNNPDGKRRSIVIDDSHDSPELAAAIALMQKFGWNVNANLPLHKGSVSSTSSVFVFENPQFIY